MIFAAIKPMKSKYCHFYKIQESCAFYFEIVYIVNLISKDLIQAEFNRMKRTRIWELRSPGFGLSSVQE